MALNGYSINVPAPDEEAAVAIAIDALEQAHRMAFHEAPLYVEHLWGDEWEVVLRPRVSAKPGRRAPIGSFNSHTGQPYVPTEPRNAIEAAAFAMMRPAS